MASIPTSSFELADDPTARPTRVRFGVLAFMCTLSFVLYLDRICMGVAKVPIQDELGLTNGQMSWIDAAFMVAYAIFEMPVGRWADRFGSRGVVTRIVLCWSLFTALTGTMSGLWGLLVVRFLFGAGEAGAFPNMARVVARWFPGKSRNPAQGIVTASAQIGGAVAPVLAAYLIDDAKGLGFGWRWTFVIFGAVGLVWTAAFFVWFRDDPAEHSGVNAAERALLAESAPRAGAEHTPLPWRAILTNRNVWLLGAAMNCGAFAFYMYVFWFPKYLKSARDVELTDSGWLSSIIPLGGTLGGLLGGFIGNWLMSRLRNRKWVRRIVGSGGFATAAVALFLSVHCDSPVDASLFTALALMCGQIQLTSWWAVAAEISGKHTAAMFGLMNSMGAIGGSLSPLFFGHFGDWMGDLGFTGRDQWDPAFYVYVAVYVIGAVCWLFVDVTKVIEREQVEPNQLNDGRASG